jgi:hypothetical protein
VGLAVLLGNLIEHPVQEFLDPRVSDGPEVLQSS